jgi:outer membrane protein OmpA-like peptidoglycan-associated protein
MMVINANRLFIPAALAALLTSCTTLNPETGERDVNRTATGAVVGAAAGGALGAIIGQDTKAAVIGAGVGALAGAAVGNYMDSQEKKLREDLAGTGVEVERQGDNIELHMPSSITFDTNQANIKPQFYPILDDIGNTLVNYESTIVHIAGHTDSTGSAEFNQQLSVNRANSVRDYLIRKGVIHERILTTGYGESVPIADNSTEEGRSQNRRVEITLQPLTE